MAAMMTWPLTCSLQHMGDEGWTQDRGPLRGHSCSPQKHGLSSLWTVQVTPITRAKANCWEGEMGTVGRQSWASRFTSLLDP